MNKVYQRIDDPRRGDCWKCCIATILGLDYDDVPNFVEFEGDRWWTEAVEFFKKHGYEFGEVTLENPNVHFLENPTENVYMDLICSPEHSIERLTMDDGIDGMFMACVYSPKYTTPEEHPIEHLHSVLCDIDFNIVHDPQKEYEQVVNYPYSRLIGFNGIRSIDVLRKIR